MDMTFLNVLLPMMFEGLKLTILIAVVGIAIGFLIGSLCGYLLQSKYKIGKAIAEVYIWIIRATPLMVQALYGYFVIPKLLGVDIGSTAVGNWRYRTEFRCVYFRNCKRCVDEH